MTYRDERPCLLADLRDLRRPLVEAVQARKLQNGSTASPHRLLFRQARPRVSTQPRLVCRPTSGPPALQVGLRALRPQAFCDAQKPRRTPRLLTPRTASRGQSHSTVGWCLPRCDLPQPSEQPGGTLSPLPRSGHQRAETPHRSVGRGPTPSVVLGAVVPALTTAASSSPETHGWRNRGARWPQRARPHSGRGEARPTLGE